MSSGMATRTDPGGELDSEYVEAWIWTPRDGAYALGPMREGLGWVSEESIRGSAGSNPDHIYFLQWKQGLA